MESWKIGIGIAICILYEAYYVWKNIYGMNVEND